MSYDLVRFSDRYSKAVKNYFMNQKKFSVHEVPKISKIVLNIGVGEAVLSSKSVNSAFRDLRLISGQHPIYCKAKKSIAGFKLRENMLIGCKVTLRKEKLFNFLEKLVFIALPRIREFRGLSIKNFDGKGNLNFGIKEQNIFPEITYDQIDATRGINITIVTTSNCDKSAQELLKLYDIPFIN